MPRQEPQHAINKTPGTRSTITCSITQDYFDHPPSHDELCQALGLSSRGSLHKHIQALVEAGLVEPMDRSHRGIRLVDQGEPEAGIPFLGTHRRRPPHRSRHATRIHAGPR